MKVLVAVEAPRYICAYSTTSARLFCVISHLTRVMSLWPSRRSCRIWPCAQACTQRQGSDHHDGCQTGFPAMEQIAMVRCVLGGAAS